MHAKYTCKVNTEKESLGYRIAKRGMDNKNMPNLKAKKNAKKNLKNSY